MCIPNNIDFEGNGTLDWLALNQLLSVLCGYVKVENANLPDDIHRSDILHELENLRKNQTEEPGDGAFVDLGHGKDWREYENADGYTHLEELLIHQPEGWEKHTRELFIDYKYNLLRKSTSEDLRTYNVEVNKAAFDSGKEEKVNVPVFASSPVLVALFHPDIRRVARYEPLKFLLAYGATDPLPDLFKYANIDGYVQRGIRQQLSPLDYFLWFQSTSDSFDPRLLAFLGCLS